MQKFLPILRARRERRLAKQRAASNRNPVFDVTPNRLITGIVTENGVVYPPFEVNLKKVVK